MPQHSYTSFASEAKDSNGLWSLLLQEEVSFNTQTLEDVPDPFSACSALTVHVTATPENNQLYVNLRVTSRYGSGEGEVKLRLTADEEGSCLKLLGTGRTPVATIGRLPGESVDALWLSGSLSIDLAEWSRQDQHGVFCGCLCAGDVQIEMFGVTSVGMVGSSFEKATVVYHIIRLLLDPVFDYNAAADFFLTARYLQASLTFVVCTWSICLSLHMLKGKATQNGLSMLQLWSRMVAKSWSGALLSHDMMTFKLYDSPDHLIMHSVVACGLMQENFNYSTAVTIFGIVSGVSEIALLVDAFTEHCAQASRMRFTACAPWESLRKVSSFCNVAGNPVLLQAILSHQICEQFPGDDLTWHRRSKVSVLVLACTLSWYFVAVAIPHCVFRGENMHRSGLLEMFINAFVCNVVGEAPVHMKRHQWAPKFHVYKLMISNTWKIIVLVVFSLLEPGAFQYFHEMLSFSFSILILQQPFGLLMPKALFVFMWVVGAVSSALCDVVMLLVAQFGWAFPGLQFGTPGWPVLGISEFTTRARLAPKHTKIRRLRDDDDDFSEANDANNQTFALIGGQN